MVSIERDNPLTGVWKRITGLPAPVLLTGIIAVAFLVRTYVWHYSNWVGLVRHGDGYLFMAQALAEGDWTKYFSHWRFLQPVYPLYLVPMYYFKLPDSLYIFWLHQSFVAGTILFLYFAIRRFFGYGCGLATAFVYAIQLQIAYWINWTLSDMAFHFHLAIFLTFALSCWQKATWKSLVYGSLSGALLVMTRPDGFFIVFSSAAVLFFRLLTNRYRPVFALAVTSVTALICILSTLGFIFFHEPARVAVLSNIHVGWGLYTGTLPTPTNPTAVDKDLIALFREGSLLSKKDPQKRNQWYWASQIGLERIKSDPWGVMRIMVTRYIAVIIPSTFRDNPSWRYLLIDRFFSSYLIFGVFFSILLKNERRFIATGLLVVAFSIYTMVSIYQREWDVRVQLSTYILLLGPASYGWWLILKKGFRFDKSQCSAAI
jgi:hypothetical protein